MIRGKDIYEVVAALLPLYVAMILAYGSIRWWKIFTPEQCSGINRFVAVFAIPFLSFHFISSNNPYKMNFRFLAADSLQKVVILVALFLWNTLTKWGSLNWTITLFSLSTLPNTLIMGVPLLKAMYGDFTHSLMVQIVAFQGVIWYTLLLFMFEYRGAKLLISEQFPENARKIASLRLDSNVSSLNCRESLQADTQVGENEELHVIVRNMSYSMSTTSSHNQKSYSRSRASNLTGVEIYSVDSSREQRQRSSSFRDTNLYQTSLQSDSFKNGKLKMHQKMIRRSKSVGDGVFNIGLVSSYSSLKQKFAESNRCHQRNTNTSDGDATNEELHMFVWSSSARSNSYVNTRHEAATSSKVLRELEIEEGIEHPVLESPEVSIKEGGANNKQEMPRVSVMIKPILIMVWRNLVRNPNTHASLLGLVWSLISFRWNIKFPSIVKDSISIMSNTGLGMAMFSLGLFTALQPKIITCGKTPAAISMAIKFLVGPLVIAATSKVMAIHGVLFRAAIVQAALPQGIVPFVFAKEYNLHADILSTSVIFGMVVAVPVTIIYYMLLEL